MNKTILVTGGAGYIGSHVVSLLGEAGYSIVVLDDLSTGSKDAILYGELILGDIGDKALLADLFSKHKIDAVIHFAGSIVVPESVVDPIKYYFNNTAKTLTLIEACTQNHIQHFIFSSTAAVYGMGTDGELDESVPVAPINPYGRSKMMIEMFLEDVALAYPDFSYVALRYFNVAGADIKGRIGQSTPNATHLIKIAVQAALGMRQELSIFGDDYDTKDGTCIRDYIHVMDLAQAHLDALSYLFKHKKSDVMNCGYGMGYSVKEVVSVVKKVTEVDFATQIVGRRAGDPAKLISKASKIKKVLGWKPQYADLELMVKTAYEWEMKLKTKLKKTKERAK